MTSWLEQANPLQVTAWATAVLAFVGLVSIVANSVLAWQARASNRISRDGVKLQAEELDLVRRQLTLAEQQFAAGRAAAQPKLRPAVTRVGNLFVEGVVTYAHGSEPAYDVGIWIRGQSQPGASWGLHTARLALITVGAGQLSFLATPATASQQTECPFQEFLQAELGPRDYWIGLTWTRLDGSTDKVAEKQTLGLAEPPGITG